MRLNEIKTDIDAICRLNGIEDYIINDDGSIDVEGDVNLKNRAFTQFPLKFRKVTGNFNCFGSKNLTTLKGAPEEVGGNFYCYECHNLLSLKYAPIKVGGSFSCSRCFKLTSLEGVPTDIGENFYCYECFNLTLLSHLKIVRNGLFSSGTPFTNLLYVFKIKQLMASETEFAELDKIINRHLSGDRDMMECQEEMIEAGFEKYARLK